MLLVGRDGASVHLSVAGYQVPERDAEPGGGDWDANWLVVAGRVQTSAGRTWSFRHPGLTTWEVAEAADWLDGAARGEVPFVPAWTVADDDEPDEPDDDVPSWWGELDEHGWKVFTEPCLSLGVAEGPGVRLLVGLGAEWAPPPFPERAHDWRCVELRLSPSELARAAAELRRELARYPQR